MSDSLPKSRLLQYFKKIDRYNYQCRKCGKTYKTPNGGVGNLRAHYFTHVKASKHIQTPENKLQTT